MAEYGYIYKTTNLINGRIYIGQKKGTINLSYLGSGKLIEKAILRYGKNNFRLEVLAFATTKPMLDGLEMKFIYEYRQVFGKEFLYNIMNGGEGNTNPLSEETKKKISLKALGRPKSKEHKRKLREVNIGKKLSKETRKKMSDSFSGRVFSEEHKRKIGLALIGNKHTLGRKHTEEAKNKLRNNLSKHKIDCQCSVCIRIRNSNVCKC